MNIGTRIYKLRNDFNLSQEKFAQILGVSRQAVQKWETGSSMPDINNLISIGKFFNISIDALILSSDKRIAEELYYDKEIQPEYSSMLQWEIYSQELLIEYRQSAEEGKDIGIYEDLFKAVDRIPVSKRKEQLADILFDIITNSPQRADYTYIEPSGLDEIKKLCTQWEICDIPNIDAKTLTKKIHGAWMGRICGCLLGKPIEGIKTDELYPLLKKSNNYPMHRYINSTDITDEMCSEYNFRLKDKCYADTISFAPVDDDTNYVVLAYKLIEKYGRDFTSYDVSRLWLDFQPKNAYATAERVAFCNFVKGFTPPISAVYKNPYREWIGAQIRGDYFGYINPGRPDIAAAMAWKDASISHIKNGIYGEMFISAMIACAAVTDDIEQIIMGGLSYIPSTSRLYEKILNIVENYKKSIPERDCIHEIQTQFNENDIHDWCHTISNAMIVVMALLYGHCDFGKSICLAVQTGFDTDCNGATVGSIIGMIKGIDEIPEEWKKPVNNELDTSIFGVGKVKISDMVDLTINHIETYK